VLVSLSLGAQAFAESVSPHSPVSRQLGYFQRDKGGTYFLKSNEFNMKEPVRFSVQEIWRYSPEGEEWILMPDPKLGEKLIHPKDRQVYGGDSDQKIFPITNSIGLFWVKWKENGVAMSNFLFSGMLCNDVNIGPQKKGDRVATCIPGKDHAKAAYVPDPKIYCIRK